MNGPVGVIGFGAMGSGIAASVKRAGRDVLAHDVDPAKADRAREVGIEFVRGLDDLSGCQELILVLPDGPDVEAVVDWFVAGDVAGKLIVDCSTIDPEVSRRCAARLAGSGAGFADAGMGGGVGNAAEGTLLFMVGCEAEHWERARALLSPIARGVVHCGPPGAGVTMKAIVNLVWLANYAADVEALVFATRAGIPPAVAGEILGQTGASNRALGMAVEQLIADDIRPGFRVGLAHKDVAIAIGAARRLGLDLSTLEPTLEILEEASESGLADEGVAAVGTVVEQRHGVDLSES